MLERGLGRAEALSRVTYRVAFGTVPTWRYRMMTN